jgi:Mg2+ and Co2+ transporter CorA
LDTRQGFEKWRRAFETLRADFALFTNLYEFPLLSNQQQGIELYDIARRYMDVEGLFREIQEEIRSSHEYLEIRAAQDQTAWSTQLTVVATVGLAFGLASSLLGMNVLIELLGGKALGSQTIVAVAVFLLCVYLVVGCVKRVGLILDFFEQIKKQSVKDLLHPKKPQQ